MACPALLALISSYAASLEVQYVDSATGVCGEKDGAIRRHQFQSISLVSAQLLSPFPLVLTMPQPSRTQGKEKRHVSSKRMDDFTVYQLFAFILAPSVIDWFPLVQTPVVLLVCFCFKRRIEAT